jgi:E3 ubiquitin-protein ligase makorin
VCTHWLKGSCAYGDKCRYDHHRPGWAPREDRTVAGYVAPPVAKPIADDLTEMPPISELRLGGALASKEKPTPIATTVIKPASSLSPAGVSEQDNSSAASSAETTALDAALQSRSPPGVDLPTDPFGGASRDAGGAIINCGGGSVASIEDGLPDDLDLVSDALEHTKLHVDSELLAAAAAAEKQAVLDRETHWATTAGSNRSGGGGVGDYYGSEGIEAQEKQHRGSYSHHEEAVYEAGVYDDVVPAAAAAAAAAGVVVIPEGANGGGGYEEGYEGGYEGHEGMYYVEGDDGTGSGGYYEEGAGAEHYHGDHHYNWQQQQHHSGSAYGSYGTGEGHSSGGEYGAFGSTGTSPGMTTTRFGGNSKSNSTMPAWHIPSAGGGSDGGWGGGTGGGIGGSTGDLSRFYASPALQSLCWEYYNHGVCSQQQQQINDGEHGNGGCQLAHGDWCETCDHYALHPVDMNAREAHVIECYARHARLKAIRRSAHVECGICMERVTEKSNPAERRFGLLNCEHAFCLSCIRNWRQQYATGADVEQALRTCPVCRTTAHFITPTSVWPATPEEREAIISGYKHKLQEIHCRHFNYGEGACPFGTSCMYRHAYLDGRLEESAPRRVAADEGEVRVVQPVRLSDFIVVQRGKVRGRRR